MTYTDFVINSAPIPKEKQFMLNIRHDCKSGWYRIWGNWHGEIINIAAPAYKTMTRIIQEKHGLSIPPRKGLIFSHRYKGYKHALLQGFLPGSAVVDVSTMYVKA